MHVYNINTQHASADVERILIGNKCDWEARRVVPKEKGVALAHNQGISFLETSAKTNYNIDEAFETLARQILKKVKSKYTIIYDQLHCYSLAHYCILCLVQH